MEVSSITETKEGQNVQIQDQSGSHHFFDQNRLVQYEFVPEGQTENRHFYKQVLGHHDRVRQSGAIGRSIYGCSIMTKHPHTLLCEAVLGQQTGHPPRAPALFARSSSLRLLALSQNERCAERHPFCRGGGDQSRSDTTTQGPEGRGIHGVLIMTAYTIASSFMYSKFFQTTSLHMRFSKILLKKLNSDKYRFIII